MRAFLVSIGLLGVLVAGAGSAWAEEAPPPAPCPTSIEVVGDGGCCDACLPRCSRLTIEAHAAMIGEPEGPPGRVSSGLPDAVDWNVLDYDIAIGGRVAYEHPAFCGWTARVAATWWGSWDDATTVTGTLGARQTPGGPVTPSPTFAVGLDSEATLFDVQASLWRTWTRSPCWCAAWGWGLRFTSFNEESTHTFPTGAVAPLTATLTGEAENTLIAAQLSGRLGWCVNDCWDVTVDLTGFVGWRHTEREVTLTNLAPLTGGTAEDDDLGFGFEAEVATRWKLSSCLSLRVGYGLLVLFDQARGYELVDFSNILSNSAGPAESEDTVLAHRAFIGLEFNF